MHGHPNVGCSVVLEHPYHGGLVVSCGFADDKRVRLSQETGFIFAHGQHHAQRQALAQSVDQRMGNAALQVVGLAFDIEFVGRHRHLHGNYGCGEKCQCHVQTYFQSNTLGNGCWRWCGHEQSRWHQLRCDMQRQFSPEPDRHANGHP